MENTQKNFVTNGGLKMPIGFRFHPTDEELVVHYLKRKALNLPLPASVIPQLDDVFHTDPWSLPGDLKENRYFFSKRSNGNYNESKKRCKQAAGCGYWKPIGKEKPIFASGSNNQIVVGLRKCLVFCEKNNKHSNQTQTRWLLHQYRLVANSPQMSKWESFGDWLVFRVFQKKRKLGKKIGANSTIAMSSTCIDFTVEDCCVFGRPPQPSSPSSSEITEVISSNIGVADQEEESSDNFITSHNSKLVV